MTPSVENALLDIIRTRAASPFKMTRKAMLVPIALVIALELYIHDDGKALFKRFFAGIWLYRIWAIMRADDVQETVTEMRHEAAAQIVERAIPDGSYHDQWLPDQLASDAQRVLGIEVPAKDWFSEDGVAETEIEERLVDSADRYMAERPCALARM